MPFANGSPHVPRVVHTAGRRAAGTAAATAAASAHAHSDAELRTTDETIRLEDVERGGGALLLPGPLRQLITLLRRTQPTGFDVVMQPDTGGASSDALNAKPLKPPVVPADLLRTRRAHPQPRANNLFEGGGPPPEAMADEDTHAGAQPPRTRPISHVCCTREGELRML